MRNNVAPERTRELRVMALVRGRLLARVIAAVDHVVEEAAPLRGHSAVLADPAVVAQACRLGGAVDDLAEALRALEVTAAVEADMRQEDEDLREEPE